MLTGVNGVAQCQDHEFCPSLTSSTVTEKWKYSQLTPFPGFPFPTAGSLTPPSPSHFHWEIHVSFRPLLSTYYMQVIVRVTGCAGESVCPWWTRPSHWSPNSNVVSIILDHCSEMFSSHGGCLRLLNVLSALVCLCLALITLQAVSPREARTVPGRGAQSKFAPFSVWGSPLPQV